MATENVDDILEDIRVRCELPAYSTTTYVTLSAAERMLSQSALRLTGVICDAFGDDYLGTLTNLTTSIGANNVALPDDFYKLRRIQWVQDERNIWPLERASIDDFEFGATQGVGWVNFRPLYRLFADNVLFWPVPDAIYNVQIFYTARIPAMVSGGTVSLQTGWAEWLVLDVCSKIRTRENKLDVAGALSGQQLQIEEQIRNSSTARDQWKPSQPRDLWGDGFEIDARSLWYRR